MDVDAPAGRPPERPGPITVILAERERLMRAALASVFAQAGDVRIVAEADGPESALVAMRHTASDLVLLSVTTPDEALVDVCRRMATEFPGLGMILLAASVDEHAVDVAVRAGVAGYLLKDVEPDELIMAVRQVAGGAAALGPAPTRALLELVRKQRIEPLPDALAELSAQEWSIVDLVAQGLTNREIADALKLSPHTVKKYVSRLLAKLHVTRRAALAALVERNRTSTANRKPSQ